jgi:hypothetical protein
MKLKNLISGLPPPEAIGGAAEQQPMTAVTNTEEELMKIWARLLGCTSSSYCAVHLSLGRQRCFRRSMPSIFGPLLSVTIFFFSLCPARINNVNENFFDLGGTGSIAFIHEASSA